MKTKKLIVLRLCMLWLMLSLTFVQAAALAVVNQGVAVGSDAATIAFTTDDRAFGYINFTKDGVSETYPDENAAVSYTTNHVISITNLTPNSQYSYAIIAQDPPSPPIVDENEAYSFTTTLSTTELLFDIHVPSFWSGNPLTLAGVTAPFAIVQVYRDGQLTEISRADEDGIVIIEGFAFDTGKTTNILLFTVRDVTTNSTLEESITVTLDANPPSLTLGSFEQLTDKELTTINITVDETVTFYQQTRYESGKVLQETPTSLEAGTHIVNLILEEGNNDVEFIIVDRAGHLDEESITIFVDTQEIQIIEDNLNQLSPTFSTSVEVIGKVNKPNTQITIQIVPNTRSLGPQDPDTEFVFEGGTTVQTTSDSEGNFNKRISLSPYGSFSDFLDENAVPQPSTTSRDGGNSQAQANFEVGSRYIVEIRATDSLGRDALPRRGEIVHNTCGNSNDWVVVPDQVFPTIIAPDHLFNGIAQIALGLNFDYIGVGRPDTVQITSIALQKQQQSVFDQTQATVQDILNTGRCDFAPRAGIKNKAFVTCNLNAYPPERFRNITEAYERLEDEQALLFPLILDFSYSFENFDGTVASSRHRQCIDIEIFMDRRVPPDFVPNKLLNTSVEILEKAVDSIDQVLQPIRTAKLITLGACLGSKVVSIFSYAGEFSACTAVKGKAAQIEQAVRGCPNGICEKVTEVCKGDGSDTDSACLACAQSIVSRLGVEKFTTQVCDRIFCPKIPSAQQYIQDVNRKQTKNPTSACIRDPNKNPSWADTAQSVASDSFNQQEGCGKEYSDQWSSGCLLYNEFSKSKDLARGEAGSSGNILSGLADNLNFCSAAESEAGKGALKYHRVNKVTYVDDKDIPGCTRLGTDFAQSGVISNDGSIDASKEKKSVELADVPSEGHSKCVATNNDGDLMFLFEEDGKPVSFDSEKSETLKVGKNEQILRPFDGGDKAIDAEGNYYQKSKDGVYSRVTKQDENYDEYFSRVCNNGDEKYKKCDKNADALRGPNSLKQEKVQQVLIDPTGGFFDSLRCVCLPALEGYLFVIRNVLNSIKNCFKASLLTGEFQSGACRALLTQYMCDWIFRAIKCFGRLAGAYDSFGGNHGDDRPSERGLTSGLGSIAQGSKRMTESVRDRYGDTASYSALISQRKLLHAVCLAAFGYDWVPELDQAASIRNGAFSINSTGFISTSTRRFVSFNPIDQGEATFVYHIGYFLAAGANVNYRLELICSNDNSCREQDGFNQSRCDCVADGNANNPQVRSMVLDQGYIQGGTTVGDGDGKGDIYRSVSFPVRFDKIKLSWTDRNPKGKDGEIIRTISGDGLVPPTCSFNLKLLAFSCGFSVNSNFGEVFFIGQEFVVQETYVDGDSLSATIYAAVEFGDLEPNQRVPKYARLRVFSTDSARPLFEEISQGNAFARGHVTMGSNYKVGIGVFTAGQVYGITGAPSFIEDDKKFIELDADFLRTQSFSKSDKYGYYLYRTGGEFFVKRVDLIVGTTATVKRYTKLSELIASEGVKKEMNNNIITLDASSQLRVKLDKNYTLVNGNAVYVEFKTANVNSPFCGTGVESFKLTVEASLHDGLSKQPGVPPTSGNSQIDPTVFFYSGDEQRIQKEITVFCPKEAPKPTP